MIDNCANCGIPARIIYLNYYSTTTQLVSEKTLLDETKTSYFCFLIVYVRVVYINRKAVKLSLDSWRWLSFATQAANLENKSKRKKVVNGV